MKLTSGGESIEAGQGLGITVLVVAIGGSIAGNARER